MLKKFCLIVILGFLIVFFIPTATEGGGWVFVKRNIKGHEFFIDNESIKYISKNRVKFSLKVLYKKPEKTESPILERQEGLAEIDCKEKKILLHQVTSHYNNETFDTETYEKPLWSYFAPNSIGHIYHKHLCKKVAGANWFMLVETSTTKFYIDIDRIKNISKNVIRTWVKQEEKVTEYQEWSKKYYNFAVAYMEWDCSKEKTKIIQVTYYYTDDTLYTITEDIAGTFWHYVGPDSAYDRIFKYLCMSNK